MAGVTIRVPVKREMRFWYPLEPERPIEDGSKAVVFEPPEAVLEGERIHQWMGARYTPRDFEWAGSDLGRCARQQVMLREMLKARVPFETFLKGALQSFGNPLEELSKVGDGWTMRTLGGLVDKKINRMLVLVRPWWRRILVP